MTTSGSESRIEEMDLLLQEVRNRNAMPLWEVNAQRGRPTVQPFLWRYLDYRDLLYRAADLVPMELAERRVFVFSNPGIDKHSATSSLYANLQIIKPGEIAPSHRHSPSALRLVIEGQGAYTAVNGEKSYMDPGDFVTTPSWTWHDHGNEGDAPMVWLDGLDVPFVQSLDANFYEQYPDNTHPLTKPDDLSLRLFGAGSLKPTWEQQDSPNSPLLNYKFERTYAALKALAEDTDGSPYDGITVEYTNPLNGGSAERRTRDADHGLLRDAAARRSTDAGAPPRRRDDLPRHPGQRKQHHRRDAVRLGAERYVRRAVVVLPRACRGGGGCVVLLQRQPGAAGAQPLPRGGDGRPAPRGDRSVRGLAPSPPVIPAKAGIQRAR